MEFLEFLENKRVGRMVVYKNLSSILDQRVKKMALPVGDV